MNENKYNELVASVIETRRAQVLGQAHTIMEMGTPRGMVAALLGVNERYLSALLDEPVETVS